MRVQLRRSTALASLGRRDSLLAVTPIVRVGYIGQEQYEMWVADYELGYTNGFNAGRAGKPYNTVGVTDEPGRSAAAYKDGYGKGYPAGQYAKAKAESQPLPPLDPKIDPTKPETPPAPPSADELKLPPVDPMPKPGDQPPPPQTNNFGVMLTFMLVVAVGTGLYFATKVM
jgi:hypothetical protein